jgi:hypothetical protein
LLQLVSFLVAIAVGLLIIGKKVNAEPPARGLSAPGDADASSKKPGKTENDAGAAAAALATPTAVSAADAGPGAAFDPDAGGLDYAVLQTESDFPSGMSEEEKASIGTGKVPIHREGPYKSPLAHPRFGGPATVKVGLVIREIRDFSITTGGFEAEFFGDFASLLGHVFAGTIQLATQAGNFGFFRRQLGLQGRDVRVERGGLLGRFLGLTSGVLAGLADLTVLRFEFVGMLATNLAAFVFTGGFTLGEFLEQSSHGLAGGVEGVDGVEGFLFRRTTELGDDRLPCFGFRLVGLCFGVGQQAGEEVGG